MDDYQEEQDENIRLNLDLFKSEFDRAIVAIKEQQSILEKTCEELKGNQAIMKAEMITKGKEQIMHWETTKEVHNLCKTLEFKSSNMQRDIDLLTTAVASMSPSDCSDDLSETVFDAPVQNKWFTGRKKEIESLETCLSFDECKGLKMSALCGLGGCGKTTLAAHFSWKRKADYDGGVFWISMEDDKKFENSVTYLALRLGIQANSFDLTLSKTLTWISKRKRPWLLVLDDVDQLNLSEEMHRVVSGQWRRQASGHVLLSTRREPKEVCESMDLEPSICFEVFPFSEDEAKGFLVARSGATTTGNDVELDELVRELGFLPLALEQAGAHIKALQCSISNYLQEYKIQRLNLLSQHPRAKPFWDFESKTRLAVHTTWLLNFEYVRKSPHGDVASSFVQAAAFFEPTEIQEELINLPLLSSEVPSHHSGNLPLMKNLIVEILTKFSLFQRKSSTSGSLSLHRLVQEVIRNRMSVEETASSLLRAARLLHQTFRGCSSPDQILMDITPSVQNQPSASVTNPSLFHFWSKLTSHASVIQKHLKSFLDQQDIDRDVKTVVLTHEASRIVYENAVHLSVHGHQEEAKDAEILALQILESFRSDSVTITVDELRQLFPHTLPLSQLLQKIILYSSLPPVDNPELSSDEEQERALIDEIRLQGNTFFKDGRFKEAVEKYTEALEASKGTKRLDPRLLNNRATAYLKLQRYEECLRDSEEYINILPNCWKGHTRKALALSGIKKELPSLCSAALAYYHNAACCRRYEDFAGVFKDLDGNWADVDSTETLNAALRRNLNPFTGKSILLLQNGQYEISLVPGSILDSSLVAINYVQDATVTSDLLPLSGSCYFQNINFETKDSVRVLPDANAQFNRCKFQSTSVDKQAIQVEGKAILLQCKISNSKGGGMVVCGSYSFATLIKCRISGNGSIPTASAGIKVKGDGCLAVHECLVHGNTEGIHVDCVDFGYLAKALKVTRCEIYDNRYEGIIVAGCPGLSSTVVIQENKIYHNGGYGIRVSLCANCVLFQRNMVFENYWWGVWVQCNSGGYYEGNKICSNKMGGIRVGKQSPGKPACVVKNNVIHDNCGPAFHEGLRCFEFYSFPSDLQPLFLKQLQDNLKKLHGLITNESNLVVDVEISLPNVVSCDFNFNNQCFQNCKNQTQVQRRVSKPTCAYCFRGGAALKYCQRCRTARYCGKECQTLHWRRHKYICQAASQRNVIEVSLPVPPEGKAFKVISSTHPGLDPTGPAYASPPPRHGTHFIVKMQTFEGMVDGLECLDRRGYVSDDYNPEKARLHVYDRSRHVDLIATNQPRLFHLIMECGMMGTSMYLSKKLYCWAAYKDGKTLQIFTNDFPPVQKW